MANSPFITAGNYPSIRRLIDPLATSADIPDTLIADDLFTGRAAAAVLNADPLAESRTGAEEAAVIRAMCLLVASYICASTPKVRSEKFPDYEVSWAENSDCAATLATEAYDILDDLPGAQTSFRVAGLRIGSGRRGW